MSTVPVVTTRNLFLLKTLELHPHGRVHLDVTARFGKRVRELRRRDHMTQDQMATRFGIDRSYISDLELGKKSVSLPTMEVFALGFKMSLSDLLSDIETRSFSRGSSS